jgi:hypothetical protein
MAKADEKGAGSFPHRMGRGRLFHCARFCLERSEIGEGLRTGTYSVFQMESNVQREVILRFRCVRRLRYLSFRALRWESLATQCQRLGVDC